MLALGLGGAVITLETGDISVSITWMSLAAIVGILLNLLLPKKRKTINEKKEVKEIKVNETKKVTVRKPDTNNKKKSVKRK